jgi:hypothetical protein
VDERQEEQAVASWQIKSCSIFCSRIQHEFCISTANNLKQVFASQISTYLNHASDFFLTSFPLNTLSILPFPFAGNDAGAWAPGPVPKKTHCGLDKKIQKLQKHSRI